MPVQFVCVLCIYCFVVLCHSGMVFLSESITQLYCRNTFVLQSTTKFTRLVSPLLAFLDSAAYQIDNGQQIGRVKPDEPGVDVLMFVQKILRDFRANFRLEVISSETTVCCSYPFSFLHSRNSWAEWVSVSLPQIRPQKLSDVKRAFIPKYCRIFGETEVFWGLFIIVNNLCLLGTCCYSTGFLGRGSLYNGTETSKTCQNHICSLLDLLKAELFSA